MWKKFNTFILAVFLIGLAHCAYGRVLVFGPESFSSEEGKHQRVTREFKVHDVNQNSFFQYKVGRAVAKESRLRSL